MKSIKPLIETKYGSFYAKITYSSRDRVYFVTIPTFPGVMTEAKTLPVAKRYAKEIIELQCLDALDENKIVIDDTHRAYGKLARSGPLVVFA